MDTYSLLREFADSWALLALFSFFVGTILWVFWPSRRKIADAAALIPLRDEPGPCGGTCANCACAKTPDFLTEVPHDR